MTAGFRQRCPPTGPKAYLRIESLEKRLRARTKIAVVRSALDLLGLRQAQEGYVAIGAPRYAARLEAAVATR